MIPVTTLDVLDKVDGMYYRSLSTMLTYFSILVALVGFLIPLLVALYQQKKFQIEEQNLKRKIDEWGISMRRELDTTIGQCVQREKDKIDTSIKSLEDQISRKMHYAEGGIFHLQATQNYNNKSYLEAIDDLIVSSEHCLFANSEANLQSNLAYICQCLDAMNKEMLTKSVTIDTLQRLDEFLSNLGKKDTDTRYRNYIRDINNALKLAHERQ